VFHFATKAGGFAAKADGSAAKAVGSATNEAFGLGIAIESYSGRTKMFPPKPHIMMMSLDDH
jgi:hypothetical protein